MTNTNCLENIKCPVCGNEDSFRIAAKTIATVTADGTEDYGDMEWDDDSYAECTRCHRDGTLRDFEVRKDLDAGAKYYATLDRNGTEDEITIFTPDGRRMLCVAFWDEPDIASAGQLKADAVLIVNALNAYRPKVAKKTT
jgi:hypothetical protein